MATTVTLAGTASLVASASSTTLALTEDVPPGDLLILSGFAGSTTMASVTVTDTRGNTWDATNNQFSSSSSNGPFQIGLLVKNKLFSGDVLTITFMSAVSGGGTATAETRAAILAAHVTGGLATSTILDPTHTATTGTSVNPAPPASSTLPVTAVVEVMAVRLPLTTSADIVTSVPSGWTELGGAGAGRVIAFTSSSGIEVAVAYRLQYKLAAPTSTDTWTVSSSVAWRTQTSGWKVSVNVDTASALADSLRSGGGHALADTASALSATLVTLDRHALADTASALSASLVVADRHALADTASALSGSLASLGGHALADTALALSAATVVADRHALADTASALSDAFAVRDTHALADTASALADSIAASHASGASMFDTALALAAVFATRTTRLLADTASALSATLTPRGGHNLADAADALSDSLRSTTARALADAALALSAALSAVSGRFLADRASNLSDTLARRVSVTLVDAIINVDDQVDTLLTRYLPLADATLALGESLTVNSTQRYADVALTLSDDLAVRKAARTLMPIGDAALNLNDAISALRRKAVTGRGLASITTLSTNTTSITRTTTTSTAEVLV